MTCIESPRTMNLDGQFLSNVFNGAVNGFITGGLVACLSVRIRGAAKTAIEGSLFSRFVTATALQTSERVPYVIKKASQFAGAGASINIFNWIGCSIFDSMESPMSGFALQGAMTGLQIGALGLFLFSSLKGSAQRTVNQNWMINYFLPTATPQNPNGMMKAVAVLSLSGALASVSKRVLFLMLESYFPAK